MQTSPQGRAALKAEEGEVLRSYRCPAGRWTIGAGITTAAGVGKVGPNMEITRAQADDMLLRALARNYEPRVNAKMTGAAQNEFDAAVSFDFNTGAIHRASWVGLWLRRAGRDAISARYRQWNKGGGVVLPGLVGRRDRELRILFDAAYPTPAPSASPAAEFGKGAATWGIRLTQAEKGAVAEALRQLGYTQGQVAVRPDLIPAIAVRKFQLDHGLRSDGVIGRATLATLQRQLDARQRVLKPAIPAATAATLANVNDTADTIAGMPGIGIAVAVLATVFLLIQAYRYRDFIAAKAQRRFPKITTLLRSF